MQNKKPFYTYLTFSSLMLLCSILILFHESIFYIEQQIIPNQNLTIQISGDKSDGGNSSAKWINKDERIWQCTIVYQIEYPYCFLQVFLGNGVDQGENFHKYQQAHLKINYQGNADNFIIFLNNFNPKYSKLGDHSRNKYNRVKISPDEFSNNTVTIKLSEFTVSEWWLDRLFNKTLPRQLHYTELNNIVNIGLQIESNHGGIEHIMHIKALTLSGFSMTKEQLYFFIILFWTAVVSLLVSAKFYKMILVISKKNKNLEELSKNKRKFEHLSKTDRLTGLNNRVGVEQYYQNLITANHVDSQIAIALLDVDFFKKINDTYGHDVGDEVLKDLAVLINSTCRIKDCVGRWGGEEFIMIWPDIDLETANIKGNDLRKKVASHKFEIPNNQLVTISIGISVIHPNMDFEKALKNCDINLYSAKEAGRNKVISTQC